MNDYQYVDENGNYIDYWELVNENSMFCKEIEDLQQRIDKAIQFIKEHNKNAGKLYYKYNGRYLLSEIKEDLLEILGGKNEN